MLVAYHIGERFYSFKLAGKNVSAMTDNGRFVCGEAILMVKSTQRDHPIWDLVDCFSVYPF